AKNLGAPYELLMNIRTAGRLPVHNFAAGGVVTPSGAALMMQLGADAVLVGSGAFKSYNPERFANAIVQETANYQDYQLISELSKRLGAAMKGIEISTLTAGDRMQDRSEQKWKIRLIISHILASW